LHQANEYETNRKNGNTRQPLRPLRKVEDLFHPGSIKVQIVQQISLLTQGMTESMLYASGAIPEPEDDETQDQPRGQYWHREPKKPDPEALRFEARSRQIQDASRLAFATASLVTALVRLQGQPGQRFTTRHSLVPDETGKEKRTTTITHTLFAPRNSQPSGVVDIAPAAGAPADSR
jgi:hypothetical protein